MTSAAEEHRKIAGAFTDRVRGVPDGAWDNPSPVEAWVARDAVQALLDDPATADKVLTNRHVGEVALDQAVGRSYTSNVFMHTWDLARATGQHETLDVAAVSTARASTCPPTPTCRPGCSPSSAATPEGRRHEETRA